MLLSSNGLLCKDTYWDEIMQILLHRHKIIVTFALLVQYVVNNERR